MKRKICYLFRLFYCFILLSNTAHAQVRDYDSTVYNTVFINHEGWTIENLITDHFRNGDSIPEALSEEEWLQFGQEKKPAFCYFDFNPANKYKYGKLYNWFAVTDIRGLAPRGWHIPRDEDWKALIQELGGPDEAGKKMKSSKGWGNFMDFSGNGTNYSDFAGMPGGILRTADDLVKFFNKGNNGYWWSSTDASKPTKKEEKISEVKEVAKPVVKSAGKSGKGKTVKEPKPEKVEPVAVEPVEVVNLNNAWLYSLSSSSEKSLRLSANKMCGLSVRCVRD